MKLLDKKEKAEHVESLVEKQCERYRHDEKRRESWRKHYMKRDYIEVEVDGQKRYIEMDKPSIESEFWYDDEYDSPLTDDPNQRKAYFMAENMGNRFKDYGLGEWLECEEALANGGCCTGRHLSEPFIAAWPNGETYPVFMADRYFLEMDKQRGMECHPMTADDIEEFGGIIEGQKAKFQKRLETYWKRYSHNVSAHGYWANR